MSAAVGSTPASPSVDFWLFEVTDEDLKLNTELTVELDNYADVIKTGDFGFLRVPGEKGEALIAGWGECFPSDDPGGIRQAVVTPHVPETVHDLSISLPARRDLAGHYS